MSCVRGEYLCTHKVKRDNLSAYFVASGGILDLVPNGGGDPDFKNAAKDNTRKQPPVSVGDPGGTLGPWIRPWNGWLVNAQTCRVCQRRIQVFVKRKLTHCGSEFQKDIFFIFLWRSEEEPSRNLSCLRWVCFCLEFVFPR